MLKKHPLIQQLSKLRESSKEAVANADIVSDDELKNYLHIRRSVEADLEKRIMNASKVEGSVLLMVCGNVGDGKSHLLSKLKESAEISAVLSSFKIFNDATESFSPDETSNDTLKKILVDFSDERLEEVSSKIILAINLGTLNNFLEEHGNEFGHLNDYVRRRGIIENELMESLQAEKTDIHFDYVNFTNRHFFNLGSLGAVVTPIAELLAKVVDRKQENPIYQSYLETKNEPWAPLDPVLRNYELLFNEEYRNVVSQLIVTCIVKEKQIISFRQLLNFVYDMIVPYQLGHFEESSYGENIAKFNLKQRIVLLLPYYIFENPNLSKIFQNLNFQDPAIRRYEGLDERIILLYTEPKPLNWLKSAYADIFPSGADLDTDKSVSDCVIAKAYMRFEYFKEFKNGRYQDDYFLEYLKYLYAYNNSDKDGLRGIIELVKSAAYSWNGGTIEKKRIIVPSSVKNSSFRVFKELLLRGILPEADDFKDLEEIAEFRQDILLCLSVTDATLDDFEIVIDYSLFVLLKNVSLGYRPNKVDRYTYIGFDRFVEHITFSAIEKKALYVDQINFGAPLDYEFDFDEEYREFTFKKITKP